MSSQIEQIRAKIDQRRKAEIDKNGNAKDLFCAVRLWAYADLLGILDTIPEHPVPADLEAEIDREIQKLRTAPCYDELRNFARHFVEWGANTQNDRDMKTGIELIAAERNRQIEEKGWTAEHDDSHKKEELAMAAVAFALPDSIYGLKRTFWPFGNPCLAHFNGYTQNKQERIRELAKAGALIAAEIDRLHREIEKEK